MADTVSQMRIPRFYDFNTDMPDERDKYKYDKNDILPYCPAPSIDFIICLVNSFITGIPVFAESTRIPRNLHTGPFTSLALPRSPPYGSG